MTDTPTLYYHFLRPDGSAGNGNDGVMELGRWYEITGDPIPCEHGYHGSTHPLDALIYAPGFLLDMRELAGKIIPHNGDKFCAQRCRIHEKLDVTWPVLMWTFENVRAAFGYTCIEFDFSAWESACAQQDFPLYTIAAYAARDAALHARDARTAARTADARTAALHAALDALDARDAALASLDARDAALAFLDARTAALHGARIAAYDARTAAYDARTAALDAAYAASYAAFETDAEIKRQRQRFQELIDHARQENKA